MPTPKRCEHVRLTKRWDRVQCKRNATTAVAGKSVCEQHAKIMLGLPPDIIDGEGGLIVRADA